MEIAGVLTAGQFLSSALGRLTKRCRPQEATASQALESPASPVAATSAATSGFREIVARYDVTAITPRNFSEMIQELHDAGLLTDQELQELSQIRLDLDSRGVEPDEEVNLLDFYLDRLRHLSESLKDASGLPVASRQAQLTLTGRCLQWVEKLAAIQSAADRGGLDALG